MSGPVYDGYETTFDILLKIDESIHIHQKIIWNNESIEISMIGAKGTLSKVLLEIFTPEENGNLH